MSSLNPNQVELVLNCPICKEGDVEVVIDILSYGCFEVYSYTPPDWDLNKPVICEDCKSTIFYHQIKKSDSARIIAAINEKAKEDYDERKYYSRYDTLAEREIDKY